MQVIVILHEQQGQSEFVYWAYTAQKGWAMCRIYSPDGQGFEPAYSSRYAYSRYGSDHVFYLRRRCRIWSSSGSLLNYLYAGDVIATFGSSSGGVTYPYRLAIRNYRKDGKWRPLSATYWADTDMELGYSGSPIIYGKW